MPFRRGSSVGYDQATRLRQLAQQRNSRALTVAVTSGKGGVGKTNIAVNLAVSVAARGLRVLLVDVDLGLANADLLMNVQPRYTLSHALSGERTLESVCVEGPNGVRFVPGASGIDDLANLSEFDRQHFISQLHQLEISTDMIVLDCGAGISSNVTSFALSADRVIVVTTPQPTALTDAYATIKTLLRKRYVGDLGVFVNLADSKASAQGAYDRIAGVANKFLNYSVASEGYMLHDTVVERAVVGRWPFVLKYPDSNAAACVMALANRLAGTLESQPERGGFFRRVVGLFV